MCYKKNGAMTTQWKKYKLHLEKVASLGRGDSPTFATPLLSKIVTNKL
jgi:hypothetical protein